MSFKRLSVLFLIALITSPILTFDEGHKCTHDDVDHPEPEITVVDEDFNPEGNDHSGRTLASYSRFRTYGYYGAAGSTLKNYISSDLIPPVLDYFSAALRVKYPVSGKLKFSTSSICGISTPSVLKSGVDADFVLVIVTDSSSDYVANSYTCNMASGTNRPLIGRTTISSHYIKATTDPLLHEKNMICMMHELTHILGFAKSMYSRFISSSGKKLSGHVTSTSINGGTSTVLNVEPLTTKLRDHFGCSTLKGAYMENSGTSATAGSHFERRIFSFEFMTSGLIYQQQVSKFTLALLEGSGWYVADYSFADPFWWGQGQGCSFVTGACSTSKFDEFCSSSSRDCTNPGRGGGSCSTDGRSDNCKFIHPSVSYDCDSSDAKAYARIPSIQAFGRGQNSKCFSGTLNSGSSAGSQTTFCFKYTCSGTGSNTALTLKLGTKEVVCTSEGKKTVSGYAGAINCPDPLTFCKTVGAKACPRNCMGRGTCNNGVCKCDSGFKGIDCAAP